MVGKESTLFVVLLQNSLRLKLSDNVQRLTTNRMKRVLSEKLALIPDTKLVITNLPWIREGESIASETVHVYLSGSGGITTMLELMNKRLETLDLISVMLELQRTASRYYNAGYKVEIRENLSCVPRFQKTEQVL